MRTGADHYVSETLSHGAVKMGETEVISDPIAHPFVFRLQKSETQGFLVRSLSVVEPFETPDETKLQHYNGFVG